MDDIWMIYELSVHIYGYLLNIYGSRVLDRLVIKHGLLKNGLLSFLGFFTAMFDYQRVTKVGIFWIETDASRWLFSRCFTKTKFGGNLTKSGIQSTHQNGMSMRLAISSGLL